ncbi:MAG TPA: DNA gyrase inhibitor YacG [Polyangia bacterium]|nr:DNA gyrase inhibitor YacG [Polyangia bacterium]
MKRKCPTCARLFAESDEVRAFRPFCSVRCRSADLGKWLDGGYKIETAASEEDLDQGMPGAPGPEEAH